MLPEKKENMEIYLIITIIAIIVMTVLGYFVGNRGKKGLIENVIKLTAERDVQKTNVENLEKQLSALRKQEMRSAIDRSVSAQMEDIANEQRKISDEKREEALQQTRIANEMRLRSEVERQNALIAERNAVASEKKALEASEVAEAQRQMAEHQRIQAEFSKRMADTLSYIALGRSLGSISTIQYQAGNDEVADLLSYASYLYTQRYKGDVYYPAVLQSLMRSSQSINVWAEHAGVVTNMEFMPNEDNKVVSVSNYGEILLSERQGNQLKNTILFNNPNYDFRDVYVEKNTGNIYIASRTGHLVVITKQNMTPKVITLEGIEHPMRVHDVNGSNLLIIGETSIGLLDMKRNIIISVKQLPFKFTMGARRNSLPLLFDDQGKMHQVSGLTDISTEQVPVEGSVTAYCESKNTGMEAYGMSDGTIWLKDKNGRIQKLVGHRSRISKMKMNGRRLISSSYDGSVNLWISDSEKIEPMTLLQTNNWIMNFQLDSTKETVWMCDAKGNLTAVNISINKMVDAMKKKLKRNLTTEEWNYYIGPNVPYEKFVEK